MAKNVLITGANKGIGLAAVKAVLQSADNTTVWLGSRDIDCGSDALNTLLGGHPEWESRLRLLPIDVSKPKSVLLARDTISEHYGDRVSPLYGIVNNAGIGLGSADLAEVVEVNTYGVKRVCDVFLPLIEDGGRVVNVSSASGPNFVSQCSPERQAFFLDETLNWGNVDALIEEAIEFQDSPDYLYRLGLGEASPYGFSKACVSLYTMLLARDNPRLLINACTPGYIETDMTRPSAQARGVTPQDMGMKSPEQGTKAIMHLLFGQLHGSGHYYGSDAKRSPMDRYRAPGDPEFLGN